MRFGAGGGCWERPEKNTKTQGDREEQLGGDEKTNGRWRGSRRCRTKSGAAGEHGGADVMKPLLAFAALH